MTSTRLVEVVSSSDGRLSLTCIQEHYGGATGAVNYVYYVHPASSHYSPADEVLRCRDIQQANGKLPDPKWHNNWTVTIPYSHAEILSYRNIVRVSLGKREAVAVILIPDDPLRSAEQ